MLIAAWPKLLEAQLSKPTTIKGTIIDNHSRQALAHASVFLKQTGAGTKTDSNGKFELTINAVTVDTLMMTYVGYKKLIMPLDSIRIDSLVADTIKVFELNRGTVANSVVVKSKFNKGLFVWKQLLKNKDAHNRYLYPNFSYEAYNKLEVDIKNFNATAIKKVGAFQPFQFLLNNIDSTSEKESFLPVYLVEGLSEFKYQLKPKKFNEKIIASNTKGIKNESITKMMGVTEQVINVNNNYIPVMEKDFISPLHNNANLYYNFGVGDTAFFNGVKHLLFTFTPKRPGQYTFIGEAWVDAKMFYLKDITLYIPENVNINYLSRVTIYQEYQMLPNNIHFIKKDKLFADFNMVGKKNLTLIGRKNTSYKNIRVNSDSITQTLSTQKTEKAYVMATNMNNLSNSAWDTLRYEPLSKNEAALYTSIDKLLELPKFKRLQNTLSFIGTGYKKLGKFEIGPWYNWISSNAWEGPRLRFDLGTTTALNKNIYLHGYAAYGFVDKQWKGLGEAYWILKRKPNRLRLHASYSKDIDNGVAAYGNVGQDNFFTLAVRKPNTNRKFLSIKDARFEVYKEFGSGLSAEAFAIHRQYIGLLNLPPTTNYVANINSGIQNFEIGLRVRFAYMEQFLENGFYRTSVGSKYPAVEVMVAQGLAGFANSAYSYTKVTGYIGDYVKVSPLGSFSYKIFGGIINGTQPYTNLEIHPGNNIYYYDKSAFNLMSRFEYIGDKYAGSMLEHNIGPGLFRFLPITRKLKWRQFYTAKVLTSNLSTSNEVLNNFGENYFSSLNGKVYTELGTGVDNILKVLRFDFIWRLTPTPLPVARVSRFGVFGSFQFQF